MTKEELIDLINLWENLPYLQSEIIRIPELYLMLIEIAFYNSNPKSWRAAYLVDKINDKYPDLLRPFLNEMIEQLKIEKSHSKKRHFLKLISQNELPSELQGFMLDFCIKTFTSAKEALAVRVHALQILYNISEKEPGLKPEILSLIEYKMENNSSAGIISRGNKIAAKLRMQIRQILVNND
jgi:hypothetical protein